MAPGTLLHRSLMVRKDRRTHPEKLMDQVQPNVVDILNGDGFGDATLTYPRIRVRRRSLIHNDRPVDVEREIRAFLAGC